MAVASGQSLFDLLSEYGQDSEPETHSSPHPNSEEPEEQSQQTQAEPWFDAADEKERQLTAITGPQPLGLAPVAHCRSVPGGDEGVAPDSP